MLSIVSDDAAYVNFLQISTVPSFDPHYGNQKKLDETDEELLELAIIELRENVFNYCRECSLS
jgi:excinuclease ABC subunit C